MVPRTMSAAVVFIGTIARRVKAPIVFVLAAALLLTGVPATAVAVVRPSDRVGDVAVGSGSLAAKAPDVDMAAGALVASDGRFLWSREADDERAMASITKIMTAVVVLERLSLSDTLTVPQSALEIGESDANLRAGEKLTVRQALEAMLVKSGNDAALALALRTSKNENAFVALMNKKAAALGMTHTKFANSYGLDEPGHYSTAADLAVLGRYAMANPTFRNIVRKEATAIGQESSRRRLETSNFLLGRYRGANGIKTGWTNDAGYSVVASANRGGEQLVAVVLGTGSESARFAAASELLDWGFLHVRRESLVASGSVLGQAQVTDYDDRFVPVLASQGSTPTVFDLDGSVRTTVRFDRRIKAPVVRGERLGVLVATQGDRLVASVPLVAGASVPAPGLFERISIGLHRWWSRIFG